MREITFDDLRAGMLVEVEYADGSMVRGKCSAVSERWVSLLITDDEWSIYRVDTCTLRLIEEPMPPEPPVGTVGMAGSTLFMRLQSTPDGWLTPGRAFTYSWEEVLSFGPFVELVSKEEK